MSQRLLWTVAQCLIALSVTDPQSRIAHSPSVSTIPANCLAIHPCPPAYLGTLRMLIFVWRHYLPVAYVPAACTMSLTSHPPTYYVQYFNGQSAAADRYAQELDVH